MREIRLLFARLPAMLSDIIRNSVEDAPDVRIVGVRPTLDGLEAAARDAGATVLVVGSEGAVLPPECARSMYERPRTGTLAVSLDGSVASAYRLRPLGEHRSDLSPADVLETIRGLDRPPHELEG